MMKQMEQMAASCETKLKQMEGKNDNLTMQIQQKNGEIDKLEVIENGADK
jgi:hypothetical protein